ncbi:MAG: hypothetical protein ACRDHN_17750 [Thermomicrobiales bacterium]
MPARLLESWSKRLAQRHSRHATIGVAIGSALTALGLRAALAQDDDLGPGESTQPGMGEDGFCHLDFEGTVRMSPGNPDEAPFVLAGLLSFKISESGALSSGTLRGSDRTYPVAGQASGRSITLRVEIGDGAIFIAAGVGEYTVRACGGEYSGPASGPARGDLGDWIASAPPPPDPIPTPKPTQTPAPTEPVATEIPTEESCNLQCDPQVETFDAATCSCICTLECGFYDKILAADGCYCVCAPESEQCGEACCPIGDVCIDPGTGQCGAPCAGERCSSFCCEPGLVCIAGVVCDCPDGLLLCGTNTCVDWQTDENNCGDCGQVCPFGMYCQGGDCKLLDLSDL